MTLLKIENYHFTLDANGNRTAVMQTEPLTLTPNTETVDYTYNTQRNRLLTAGADGFTYERVGSGLQTCK